MGEAVLMSSEDNMDVDCVPAAAAEEAESTAAGGVGIKWERFLPKMMIRVLLVEADDSTRQIITALLRKCCYRVAAVPDGLKAWEILKEKPCNVDLILAEVELPSISGFALLTLIREHETCKNIPVIMMSPKDSIGTVYKCMMKGAADYLVKPLRRNELRNLWQHVWRRQASSNVRTDIQEKVEATSEYETASNHSTDYVAGVQRNNKNIEKGSDTQSSCTKVDFEARSTMQENSQPRQENSQLRQGKASSNDIKIHKDEHHISLSQRLVMHENGSGGLAMSCYVNADVPITLSMGLGPINDGRSPNIANEAGDNKDLLANPSRDETAFACFKYPDNYKSTSSTNATTDNFCSALHLDLSLRRYQPNDFEDHAAEGRGTLNHSSASAFTRYTFRPLQRLEEKPSSICDEQKEFRSNPEYVGSIAATSTSDTNNPTLSPQKNSTSMPLITGQSTLSEVAMKDLMSNTQCSGYGSAQRGTPSPPRPTLVSHPEPIFTKQMVYPSNHDNHNLEQFLNQYSNMSNSGQKLECTENQGHISSDHSANSSLCGGGNTSRIRSMGYPSTCGSNSNVDQVGGDSHRSSQREAALTKFRLKRKDRCYEKKVRYESRKKLAEQRPRVKGQFVRREIDTLPAETTPTVSSAACKAV